MRELNVNEVKGVSGGVNQSTAIGVNTAIATTGAGLSATMAATGITLSTTGVGIVAGLILVSLSVTMSYIMKN